ncbi:hypothetical protein RND81_05G242800 [Saponaria officinalis]|uniref:Protein TIFY n=1 Tax=Saponaria officinalis TaxID=3572 RepID=A0AAW1L3C9_SAPOF
MTQESVTTGSSNFARTCNRLSRFLKERRCFGEVGFNGVISPRLETEGNNINELLFTSKNNNNVDLEEKKSLDLFPLTSSSSTLNFDESTNNNMVFSRNSATSNEEANKRTTGSMTIIYDGKVVVYEGLRDEMAQEIMSLATQNVVNNTTQHDTSRHNYNNMTTRSSDFPILRGASLHRFMEKRKDRYT